VGPDTLVTAPFSARANDVTKLCRYDDPPPDSHGDRAT